MRHAACHFSVTPLTRGKTAGAVARAAYIGRCRLHDERTGQTFSYVRGSGLLEQGTVNWSGGLECLWNAVERSETRKNSRVAREIRVALPVELPLDEMLSVVHGYCCNLVDRYGLAAQWVIHAPSFHDREVGRRVERRLRQGNIDREEYLTILADPSRTNQNFHAHILISNRCKDRETSKFMKKIRCLDDVETGPEEIQNMREEREYRTNSALERTGSTERIDLRSYVAMAAEGHAPDGLVAQQHVGPTASHVSTARYRGRVNARKEIQRHNANLWMAWEQRRALERERARIEASEKIAAERESKRKTEAVVEKRQIAEAQTEQEAQLAAREAFHRSYPRPCYGDIFTIMQQGVRMEMPAGEDVEIDPETYECDMPNTPFDEAIFVKRKAPVRVRVRSK